MSPDWIALSVGCVLQVVSTEVERTERGWEEAVRLEVGADPLCGWVEVHHPPAVTLEKVTGRTSLGDGGGHRLGPERFEDLGRSLDGDGWLVVHLPELVAGDRAIVKLTRHWDRPDPFVWAPVGARFSELSASKDLIYDIVGAQQRRDGSVWAADVGPATRVTLSDDATVPWTHPWKGLSPPAKEPEVNRWLTIEVPAGNPQFSLYPGGGSTVRIDQALEFSAGARGGAWQVSAPRAIDIPTVRVTPRAAADVEMRSDDWLIRVHPSEGRTTVNLSWRQTDAPTFGERTSDLATLKVTAPAGLVSWESEERLWWLGGIGGQAVLPDHERLVRALDRRFRRASVPEPGLPGHLRGEGLDWELAAKLAPALRERVAVGHWPHDAALPRQLGPARRSGAVTPVEAGLILWLYALQAGFDADWVLVRPASEGPGGRVSLAGYSEALVRVQMGDEVRWIDAACAACGPFEVRPELEGASTLSAHDVEGPSPTPGLWEVVVEPDRVAWRLKGPAALQLRRSLARLPEGDRLTELAVRMGGGGASIVESRGVDEPGATIEALALRGSGPPSDPLSLPVVRTTDGTAWVDWIGDRVLRAVDVGSGPTEKITGEHVTLTTDGSRETLSLRARRLSGTDVRSVDQARRAATATPIP